PATSNPSGSKTIACLLYLFRWNPGRNSALLANLHRPDVCLPAIGWTQVADTGVRQYPVTASLALPFRHFEFRHGTAENSAQQVAHAFYCLWEDRMPNAAAAGSKLPQMATAHSTWTRDERVRQVLEGRRHLGQQACLPSRSDAKAGGLHNLNHRSRHGCLYSCGGTRVACEVAVEGGSASPLGRRSLSTRRSFMRRLVGEGAENDGNNPKVDRL